MVTSTYTSNFPSEWAVDSSNPNKDEPIDGIQYRSYYPWESLSTDKRSLLSIPPFDYPVDAFALEKSQDFQKPEKKVAFDKAGHEKNYALVLAELKKKIAQRKTIAEEKAICSESRVKAKSRHASDDYKTQFNPVLEKSKRESSCSAEQKAPTRKAAKTAYANIYQSLTATREKVEVLPKTETAADVLTSQQGMLNNVWTSIDKLSKDIDCWAVINGAYQGTSIVTVFFATGGEIPLFQDASAAVAGTVGSAVFITGEAQMQGVAFNEATKCGQAFLVGQIAFSKLRDTRRVGLTFYEVTKGGAVIPVDMPDAALAELPTGMPETDLTLLISTVTGIALLWLLIAIAQKMGYKENVLVKYFGYCFNILEGAYLVSVFSFLIGEIIKTVNPEFILTSPALIPIAIGVGILMAAIKYYADNNPDTMLGIYLNEMVNAVKITKNVMSISFVVALVSMFCGVSPAVLAAASIGVLCLGVYFGGKRFYKGYQENIKPALEERKKQAHQIEMKPLSSRTEKEEVVAVSEEENGKSQVLVGEKTETKAFRAGMFSQRGSVPVEGLYQGTSQSAIVCQGSM